MKKVEFVLLRVINTVIIATALFGTSVLQAEEEDDVGIANYAYSVFAGTGEYRIDDRTIYVFRAPLSWDLSLADYETVKIGYRLLLPASVGVTNFKDIGDQKRERLGVSRDLSLDELQTVSMAPGAEIVIPAAEHWELKPFAHLGFGSDLKSDAHSFIWGAGVRARYSFHEDSNWLIGGEFLYARDQPNEGVSSTSLSRLGLGAEYKLPTAWQPFGHRVSWHARLLQWYFTDTAEFQPPFEKTTIRRSTEVGVSFGIDPPISILGYEFTQGGIGFEKADGYDAITFFTTFPF